MYILENDKLAVHVLPELGGKITSLYLKEKEFELAAPNRTGQYRLPGGVAQTGKKTDFGPFPISIPAWWNGRGESCIIRIMGRSGAI